MADIDVVRKGRSVWPWLIAIALVVVALFWMNRDRYGDRIDVASTPTEAVPASPVGTSGGAALPAAVSAFVAFADTRPPADVGLTHTYTSTGIDRLTTALEAVTAPAAEREDSLARQLAAFREQASRLQADPASRDHANIVRDVFTSAVDVMAAVQQRHLSNASAVRGQIDELRQSAEAVDAATPLLDQTARVTAFFDRAADTLEAMARARRA